MLNTNTFHSRKDTKLAQHRIKRMGGNFLEKGISSCGISAVVIYGSIVRNVRYCADVDLLIIYSGKKPKIYPQWMLMSGCMKRVR